MKKAFQMDLARQIERPDFLAAWLRRHAEWGYEQVYLYLEDAFDYPSVPGLGRRYAYSPRTMDRVVREAGQNGLEVVPVIPMWGHTSYILKHDQWKDLSETRGPGGNPLNGGQVCPLDERLLELADKLIQDVAPFCTAGAVHLSLDESFEIGKCPKCREEIKSIGLGHHFAGHVSRLESVCHAHGLKIGLWADMLHYIPEAIPLLPKSAILYDWFYYPFQNRPRVELFNYAGADLTGRLKKAGFTVFGCPNNGPFFHENLPPVRSRLQNIFDWWNYCRRKNADGLLVTSWAAKRTSAELACIINAAAASLWLEPGRDQDPESFYQQGLKRVYQRVSKKVGRLLFEAEKFQHAGYYRWQADKNWKALATFATSETLQEEERHFAGLASGSRKCKAPGAIRDSLIIRHYLAARQYFINEGAQRLVSARQATHQNRPIVPHIEQLKHLSGSLLELANSARSASGRLWRSSRYAGDPDPTAQIIKKEIREFRAFQKYLDAALIDPERLFESSMILGRWHLLFHVRNFAPALQGMAVEEQLSDGSWKPIHNLFSLEFTDEGCWPKTDIVHRHSVPVEWSGRRGLRLRLGIRGIGQLEISGLKLTNGVREAALKIVGKSSGSIMRADHAIKENRPGALLGQKAPKKGFPEIDWSADQAWMEIEAAGCGEK